MEVVNRGAPLELELGANASSCSVARQKVTQYAKQLGVADVLAVKAGVSEAVAAAVGYASGVAELPIRLKAFGGNYNRLVVIVHAQSSDGGPPRSPGEGLGFPLMLRLADQVLMREDSRSGMRIEMRFARA